MSAEDRLRAIRRLADEMPALTEQLEALFMTVRCQNCGISMDRDEAHDTIDTDDHNRELWWCVDCCPRCSVWLWRGCEMGEL